MAFSSSLQWDIRPSGSDSNGGGFDPVSGVPGTDFSIQDAAQVAYTDIVIDAATNTNCTSAGTPFTAAHVGNIINITSGTGFTVQRVQIMSVAAGIATCDKSLGTLASTGGTGNLGGGFATGAVVGGLTVAGNTSWLKAATYTLTTTWNLTTIGTLAAGRITWRGYSATHGDEAGRPVITSATNSVALLTLNNADYTEFRHIKFTHTAATRGVALNGVTSGSAPVFMTDCIVDGCLALKTDTATTGITDLILHGCEVLNCTSTTAAISIRVLAYLYGCDIHDNAGDGIRNASVANSIVCYRTTFDTNVNGINDVSTTAATTIILHDCTFVDNSNDGVKIAAKASDNTIMERVNNIFYNNAVYGVEMLDSQIETETMARINRTNFYGANGTAPYTGLSAGIGDVTLTADPFTSRAGRDFTPSNTAGGGASVRAAAFPHTYPGGTTTNYADGGAVQHQDAGGGGGAIYHGGMSGGLL